MMVRDVDMGYAALKKRLNDLALEVRVGVRQDQGEQRVPSKEGEPPTDADPTLAEIAAYNEFGLGVPERSFLRSTVDAHRGRYIAHLRRGLMRWIDTGEPMEAVLEELGAIAAGDVKDTIRDLTAPPNADATIRKKGSSNPLIDTGRLRQSIDWETG